MNPSLTRRVMIVDSAEIVPSICLAIYGSDLNVSGSSGKLKIEKFKLSPDRLVFCIFQFSFFSDSRVYQYLVLPDASVANIVDGLGLGSACWELARSPCRRWFMARY